MHVSAGTGQEAGKEAMGGERGIKEEGRQIVGSCSMRTALEAAASGILTWKLDYIRNSWGFLSIWGLCVFFSITQVLFRLRGLEPPQKTGSLYHDRSFSVTSFLGLYCLPIRTTASQLMTKWCWPRVLIWLLMSEGQIKQLDKQFQLESQRVTFKLPSFSNVVQRILIFLAFLPPLDQIIDLRSNPSLTIGGAFREMSQLMKQRKTHPCQDGATHVRLKPKEVKGSWGRG